MDRTGLVLVASRPNAAPAEIARIAIVILLARTLRSAPPNAAELA